MEPERYIESVFVDSGAFTLFAKHVRARKGSKGQTLEAPGLFARNADYSYYDLKPGTEFRAYCDSYAAFIKKVQDAGVLVVNVDAIHNPEKTWEIQEFFEKEHGLRPVPVVHSLSPLKWLDRYLDTGKYDLIGIGGFGHSVPMQTYLRWTDQVFDRVCPESNKNMPLVRLHGFAMTAWKVLVRYPWWSVDSATWVKTSAYGILYVPQWKGKWLYDRPPVQINLSAKSGSAKKQKNKHIDNCAGHFKELVHRWLDYCGVKEGTVDEKGEEVERGVISHYIPRNRCNLLYFKGLEESRPPWPYPLDRQIVKPHGVSHRRGFQL